MQTSFTAATALRSRWLLARRGVGRTAADREEVTAEQGRTGQSQSQRANVRAKRLLMSRERIRTRTRTGGQRRSQAYLPDQQMRRREHERDRQRELTHSLSRVPLAREGGAFDRACRDCGSASGGGRGRGPRSDLPMQGRPGGEDGPERHSGGWLRAWVRVERATCAGLGRVGSMMMMLLLRLSSGC